ncbi:MAG: ABC transporter permease [Bradymonadales bacterium]|nr:MAG: ABC transporter permease [Bradymonadales bacterium]
MDERIERGSSLWRDALKRLFKNKAAMAGLGFFVFMVFAALFGPLISPHSYEAQYDFRESQPPAVFDMDAFERRTMTILVREDYRSILGLNWNTRHWLGTDTLGRDMLARLLFGARVSLAIGFLAGIVSLVIGVLYGAIAGYLGGRLDNLMMRFVDTLYSLPYMFFVILLMALAGRSFVLLFVAIGAVSWLTTARIVRGQIISLKNSEFVEAALASGTGHWKIITRHLIPNTLGPIIVYFSLIVPRVILEESFLSFIGLGVQAPMASWGLMVAEARGVVQLYPYIVLIPGITLTLTLFSLNFLGDGLRDALDPRLKGKQ